MIGGAGGQWRAAEHGWRSQPGEGVTGDKPMGHALLREVSLAAGPGMTGRVTVPILWNTQRKTIVSNESSEIIRMFNSAFDAAGAKPGDYYPDRLRPEIDALNERIYDAGNNGVYKAGFASTQCADAEADEPRLDPPLTHI